MNKHIWKISLPLIYFLTCKKEINYTYLKAYEENQIK